MTATKSRGQRIQSVERALEMLEYVAQHGEGVALADFAKLLGVSKVTALNLAETLGARGFLERMEQPLRYRQGCKWFEMTQHLGDRQFIERIAGRIRELATRWPEANWLAVTPAIPDLLIRLRMDPTRPGVLQQPLQPASNPYDLASTLCITAFLPQEQLSQVLRRYPLDEFAPRTLCGDKLLARRLASIRKSGGVVVLDQRPRAAFPLFDRSGQVVAAIGASLSDDSPASRSSITSLADTIRQTAGELSESPFKHHKQQPTNT